MRRQNAGERERGREGVEERERGRYACVCRFFVLIDIRTCVFASIDVFALIGIHELPRF